MTPNYWEVSALAEAIAGDPACAAIFVDATGTIRSWSSAAEAIFGHSAEAAIGSRADIIVPGPLRDVHWAGFGEAMRSSWRGAPGWGPIEPLHKSGELLALEVFLTRVNSGTQAPGGVLAMFRQRRDQ